GDGRTRPPLTWYTTACQPWVGPPGGRASSSSVRRSPTFPPPGPLPAEALPAGAFGALAAGAWPTGAVLAGALPAGAWPAGALPSGGLWTADGAPLRVGLVSPSGGPGVGGPGWGMSGVSRGRGGLGV